MLQASPILNTKLLPPSVSEIIHRERIAPLLSQFKQKQLITVTAGAGYGKTTLIAHAIQELDLQTVWYSLDRSDEDFITFLHYLATGVNKIYPKFGVEILSILGDPRGSHRNHEALLTLFINDVESLTKEDLYLVLDDYQSIGDGQEINNALQFLLKHLPDRIHLILISRKTINLPLSRLRAMRKVLDITWEDLLFSPSEIKQLFTEIFDLSIREAHVEIIFEKTKGWISGLILLSHMLKGRSEEEKGNLLVGLRGSMEEFYRYLDENVFQPLTPHEKEFLVKTSILSKLTPELCNSLLNIADSGEILRQLQANHLFTFSLEGEEEGYIYHDLFKDFLRTKLVAETDEKEFRKIHASAAVLHEKNREYALALDHYLKAERMEDANRLISMFARMWIKQGQVLRIRFYLGQIPAHYAQEDPWMVYLQAGLMELSGRLQEAATGYARSLGIFQAQSSTSGIDICLADLATCYYTIGDYEKSESLCKELLTRNTSLSHIKFMCLGFLIYLSYALGKTSDSDRFMEQARSMLPEIIKGKYGREMHGWLNLTIGRRFILAGDFKQALEILNQALEILQHTGLYPQLVYCYLSLSETYYYLGLFEKGLDAAKTLLNIAQGNGLNDSTFFPGGHLLLACNYLGMGRKEEALSYAQRSLARFQETGMFDTQVLAHRVLFSIYFDSGDLYAAEEHVRQGMKTMRDLRLPLHQSKLEICLAAVMMEKGEWDRAMRLLKTAETRSLHGKYHQAMIFLEYTRCYLKRDQIHQAIKTVRQGLSLCEANGYDYLLVKQKSWIIPLLVMVFSGDEKKAYIRKILSLIGPEAVAEISGIITNSPSPPMRKAAIELFNVLRQELSPALKIHFFGKFRVFIGEKELPIETWQSKKALNLFKFLVFYRSRGYINKEMLMEFLWPDEDPQKSANRLHVALNFLRKALEPKLAKGITSSYILSNAGAYKLNMGGEGWVDIEEFSRELKDAKKEKSTEESIRHYLKALDLYEGDFLEEDLYIDWCNEVRERYREHYLAALTEVIGYYEARKEFQKCIDYAEAYLKTDKYAEEIYRVLMRCHSYLGRRAMVAKTFKKCKENIVTDLKCPLSSETIELTNQLGLN
jgi:LuxR family maltose regulon positive regulatory protein